LAKKKTRKKGPGAGRPRSQTPPRRRRAPRRAERGARRGKSERASQRRELPIVPVRNMILFPGVVLPLMVGRDVSIRAIQAAVGSGSPVGLLLQRDEQIETPGPDDLFRVGTMADIVRFWEAPDGRHQAICQGTHRFRVLGYKSSSPMLVAEVEIVEEEESETRAIEARFVALRQQAYEVLQLAPGAPEDLAQAVQRVESPSMLADLVATFMDVPVVERQGILETFDLRKRLDKIHRMLADLAEVLRLSQKIRSATKTNLDKAQREYYLREQLRAIERELGDEDGRAEVDELRARFAALKLPEGVEKEVGKELRRLERTPEQAAEYSMLRTYLDVVVELPWNESTEDSLDLARARAILDEDHFGLDKVKKRILEFLAVRKLNPAGQGPTLCLVGPPGVGKTSLGQSVARALGRRFLRVSLGGVHDEAEIRGHRRTYIGAMPGNIVTGLRKAGSRNPVFMLDELDKLGVGLHGDPASALLEVLDPAQNHTFQDNYLGVPFDLRSVLFIGTANVLESIPAALRDRLEVIHIPGYTEDEKLQIGRRYLVKRCVASAGLKAKHCRIDVATLRAIIHDYTREAGVRHLEREIGAVCRHVAVGVAEGRLAARRIRPQDLRAILGPPRFESDVALRTSNAGVVTGLAWTPVGGEILFIEATRMPGKGELLLTGQLGDVMKESARAALSLVKNHCERYGVAAAELEGRDVHLHIPAGAVPKDGPSAGVAMYTALVSLLTGRKAKGEVAMTGEISLRGLVLPVGGVKEKVLAALAAGIRTVLLPARNAKDLEEIPETARRKLSFVWLERAEDAVAAALEKKAG